MKILSVKQTQILDQYTIEYESIRSIDLMERASLAFVDWFVLRFSGVECSKVVVFCGIGNNGGDGLAIARLLHQKSYDIKIFCCVVSPNTSLDFKKNKQRLRERHAISVENIPKDAPFPALKQGDIIIDAIFGSGLNRPIIGYWADLIQYLNQLPNIRVAVDIPSGASGECFFNTTGNPGMATAGSGDVLTGILTGLLAQGYTPKEACLIGVYLHGLAGDCAASKLGYESLIASDLIQYLGNAFQQLY